MSALRNTRVFWRFARKFYHEINGSKLSKLWLALLSENPVEVVDGRSLFPKQETFLGAVFSMYLPLKLYALHDFAARLP